MTTTIIIIQDECGGKHHHKVILKSKYYLQPYKIITSMSQITVPSGKSLVEGKLIPMQGGNALDLSVIQTDSDNYSSDNEGVAVVSKTSFGSFVVKRASDSGGTCTITYSALNSQGNKVEGSDQFTFDANVVTPVADSLSASYGEAQ